MSRDVESVDDARAQVDLRLPLVETAVAKCSQLVQRLGERCETVSISRLQPTLPGDAPHRSTRSSQLMSARPGRPKKVSLSLAETVGSAEGAPINKQIRDAETISLRLDDIRTQVLAMIESGALKPGERVNEQALAAQLGVGRSAAREALRSLERSGLVRIVPNRGAEIRKVSLEQALDLYDLRAGLARVSGRLAAARLSEDEEKALSALLDAMETALQQRDGATYTELNDGFHRCLMTATKNPRLIELNQTIEGELRLYIRKGVYTVAQMQASHEEHRRLFDALRNGRVTDAAEAFEAHILTGKQRMLDTVTHSGGRS